MATYVVSDLHGQFHLFEKLLERISFSDDDFLYFAGDAIDRGSDGIKILLKIMDSPNMDLLLGNHEFMMLNTISHDGLVERLPGGDSVLWMYSNGGEVTFKAYKDLEEVRRKELVNWLMSRQLTKLVEVGGRTFCITHSYFREECIGKTYGELDYDTIWSIVWNTPFRYDIYVPISDYSCKPWTFVIGHVPVQRISKRPELKAYKQENVYVIDGGCSYKAHDMLADDQCGAICLRLDDLETINVTFAEVD
jgi:serine/threonine protein phosphatase 1